ncbi:hypothetical protein CLAFUW4_05237 [Fulvia fulva]|uniref:Uncharacterized protein n=1 Tax=Passalora fulva TaxID=5499 RepID=A0A9Q8P994_PASFU|nr:uncharacterized protein CLAFUR5_05384 [Fulvia fulva]KAK4623699.1 hypothetical protein CLAFUR4_05231 [Fulvia fulva]KAK4625368.1 hypothetical protein CLAFUR0_05237 [Fulvia fulva]UJO17923.1 hypothetical protein CLAFUR5_05384 [Fulvia fulva]WPV14757.1 hypothetical protein CLAFUW4_05237 [Fulvia fulva]WPV30241.1 hypothetical protein CLAFUW7_05236 [Fulvia fulva]
MPNADAPASLGAQVATDITQIVTVHDPVVETDAAVAPVPEPRAPVPEEATRTTANATSKDVPGAEEIRLLQEPQTKTKPPARKSSLGAGSVCEALAPVVRGLVEEPSAGFRQP